MNKKRFYVIVLWMLVAPEIAQADTTDNPMSKTESQESYPIHLYAPDQDKQEQQDWLKSKGVDLHLRLQNNAFTSINYGVSSGRVESISSYSLGADLDLQKLLHIDNAQLHIEVVRNFDRQNNSLGSTIGGFPLAQIPQNAPVQDVPVFTYQQKLFDQRLDLELGRKNVVWYFIDEFSMYEYFSRLNQYTWLTLPPPYATWSAKAKYDLTDHLYAQVGIWDYDVTKWGYDGWDWSTTGSSGNTTLATLGWKDTDPKTLEHIELTYYKINAAENDPYYTVTGKSKVLYPDEEVRTHKGADAFILSGGKLIKHLDGKIGSGLYAYSSIGVNTDSWIGSGVSSDGYVGLSLLDPLGRKGDVVGVKLAVNQLSKSTQKYLEDSNLISGGTGYTGHRTSEFVQLYGHFNIGRYITFDPYVAYGFHPNTYFSPTTLTEPREGWIAGTVLVFDLGKLIKDKIK